MRLALARQLFRTNGPLPTMLPGRVHAVPGFSAPPKRSTIARGGHILPMGTEMKRLTFFLFTTAWDGPLSPPDPDNPEARWVKPSDVAPLLTHPRDKEFVLEFLKNEA